jgi:Methyltransferase FkbM domain
MPPYKSTAQRSKDCGKNIVIALLLLGLGISNIMNSHPSESSASDLPSIESFQIPRSTSIADGCYHVFLDVGANIGVHTRFLFEPEQYPGSHIAKQIFDKVFGMPSERDNRDLCAIAFEPNPAHRARLEEFQKAYQAMGWRYIPMYSGVGDQEGSLTFYHQEKDEEYLESGFSTQKFGPNSIAETVPITHLAKFLIEHVRSRNIPKMVYGNYGGGPKVVMKMDVESMEFFIVPDMIASGALCTTVDYFFGEVHTYEKFFPLTLRSNETFPVGGTPSLDAFHRFLYAMTNAGNCKTEEFFPQDDESYFFDGIPWPVPGS